MDAEQEFLKRLQPYCKLTVEEVQEARLPDSPSRAEIDAALEREAATISARCTKNGAVVAMCVEGDVLDSGAFADFLRDCAISGVSRLNFIIGGSFGLAGSVKSRADRRFSMSKMTFPHHLARIMLLEQIYRGFKIGEGGKYHK